MKTIEEVFSIKLDKKSFYIVARNYNDHKMNFESHGSECLNTDEMRKLGKFIIETADKIDKDEDFKK